MFTSEMYVPDVGMYGFSRKLQDEEDQKIALADVIEVSILSRGIDEKWGERNLHFSWNITDFSD